MLITDKIFQTPPCEDQCITVSVTTKTLKFVNWEKFSVIKIMTRNFISQHDCGDNSYGTEGAAVSSSLSASGYGKGWVRGRQRLRRGRIEGLIVAIYTTDTCYELLSHSRIVRQSHCDHLLWLVKKRWRLFNVWICSWIVKRRGMSRKRRY